MKDTTFKAQAEVLIDEVKKSDVSPTRKVWLTGLLQRAADATNGVSQADKMQALSEVSFATLCMMVQREAMPVGCGTRFDKILSAVVKCRVCLTVVSVVLGVLAMFHPEIVQMAAAALKGVL